MPRYDEFYDRAGRYDQPSRARPYPRWHHYRNEELHQPPARYRDQEFHADDFGEYLPMGAQSETQERMGMRDFSERHGRYSGGSPYSYEYSERTIYHRPRFYGPIGFSRPLGEERFVRGHRRIPQTRERWYGRAGEMAWRGARHRPVRRGGW